MAPTSEERREVAARLKVYSHDFDFGDSNPFWYVMKAVFADCKAHAYYETFARLADLIDPDERTSGGILDGEFVCHRCGHTYMFDKRFRPVYCPDCGARVVSDDGDDN